MVKLLDEYYKSENNEKEIEVINGLNKYFNDD